MRSPNRTSALRLVTSALVVRRASGRRSGHRREPEGTASLPPEPDPLRSRHRRLGRAVRVAGDALHEQRLPAALDRRGRLQLDARGGGQERGRSADRRGDRGAQAADGQGPGRRGRPLARHHGDVRLPDERGHGRAAAGERRHYINVDGQNQNPGVPTLAVWAGRGTPGRHMDGAQNVTIPNQTHVQACTSAESFVEYYKFLTGAQAGARHRPAERADTGRGKGAQLPAEQRAAWARPCRSGRCDGDGRRTLRPRRSHRSRSPTARRAVAPGGRSPSRPARATSSRSCAPACRRSTSTTSRS